MSKFTSKKAGFWGTLIFHSVILLICFFTSIGHTHIDVPVGIEIEFLYDLESEFIEAVNTPNSNLISEDLSIKNENNLEKLVVENNQNIQIPHEQDSLTLSDSDENKKNTTLSIELENALSKLGDFDGLQKSEDSIHGIKDLELMSSAGENTIDDYQDGYTLSDNRFAVRKVKPNYSCEEFGKIVVRVWVNREGKTIKAEPGIRGTTESAACLFKEAKDAALNTTWTPYFNAPEVQIGQITYNFHKY